MKYKKGDILVKLQPFKNKSQEGFEAGIRALKILKVYKKPRGFSEDTYSVKLLSENFVSKMNDERLEREGYCKTILWTMNDGRALDEEDLGNILDKKYYKPLHRQFRKELTATPTLKKI
tara:strand:+ start:146 stop:502 length:357 start_codon:yes stop_codon:yes gene_type:complete